MQDAPHLPDPLRAIAARSAGDSPDALDRAPKLTEVPRMANQGGTRVSAPSRVPNRLKRVARPRP